MLDQPVPNPLAKNPNVHTHKVFATVGLILIGTIIAIAGIWWYTVGRNPAETPVEEDKTDVATTSATATSLKDETADWKTFTSSAYGYSIKYPEEWLTNNGQVDQMCAEDIVFFAPTKETLGLCGSGFGGMVTLGIIDSNYKTYTSDSNFNNVSDLENGKVVETIVAGSEAKKISGTYKESFETVEKGDKIIRYYVNLNDKVLYVNYFQKSAWRDYSKEFEQMVSSLKFL